MKTEWDVHGDEWEVSGEGSEGSGQKKPSRRCQLDRMH